MCLAVPGKILEVEGEDPLFRSARVSFGGLVRRVSLTLVPEAKVDDHVLVHVGVALSIVDETEAAEVWRYLEEMGELEELGPGEASHGEGAHTGAQARGEKGSAQGHAEARNPPLA